ncbi:MAG: hypothetical protein KDC80_21520, partial [Saprospiraceae bacterium]|nr:hypothetical protein [Saprospiraceae bacterium]
MVISSYQLSGQNDLVVNGSMAISGKDTFDNVIIQNGGTLNLNGELYVNDDMIVESGGIVTHSLRFEPGL